MGSERAIAKEKTQMQRAPMSPHSSEDRMCRCLNPAYACYRTSWGDTIIFCAACCPRGLRPGFGLDMKDRKRDYQEYRELPQHKKDYIRHRRRLVKGQQNA